MLFTTKWLNTVFPENQGSVLTHKQIKKVTIDSRQRVPDSLFIPIVGERFDGHDYIEQAIEHGAIAVIWEREKALPRTLPENLPIYFVDNTTVALQKLANAYRQKVNPVVIGITGSNGKTTTKDLVTAVVQTTYHTHATAGNFNNHIGLPLTILEMLPHTEVLVLEMGMNDFKEIELLSKIAMPNYAIITNVGESHIEFLGSREGIARAKLEITRGMTENGTLIVDGDELLLQKIVQPKNIITCGFSIENDVVISNIRIKQQHTEFNVSEDVTDYQIPLLGNHNAKNAAYVITLGKALKIDTRSIKKGLEDLQVSAMRFEIFKGKNGVSIINDAYNASPTSMKASIEVVKQMDGFKNKILVLGDIFELGSHSERLHASVAEVIDQPITNVYTYGQDAIIITDKVKEKQPFINSQHFLDQTQLIEQLQRFLTSDTLILFKASRGMHFETLVKTIL